MDKSPLNGAESNSSFQNQHDLSNAMRTIRLILEELESGYRFDDSDAQENLLLFRKSVERLEAYLGR